MRTQERSTESQTRNESPSRQRLDNMRLGARRNPDTPVWQPIPEGRLVVRYQPIRDPVTQRVIKSKTEAAIQSLLYVWTAETAAGVVSLVREADILALLDGEPLADVQARRARDAGDVFGAVQHNLPLWARER